MAMAMAHDYLHGMNPHYLMGTGEKTKNDKSLTFYTTGNERVQGRTVERGKKYEVRPSLFDRPVHFGDWQLEVVPNVDTDAQRAARFQLTLAAYKERAATYDELLESRGIGDVSKMKTRLAADQRYQLTAAMRVSMARMDFARRVALREGRDERELMLLAGGLVGVEDTAGEETGASTGNRTMAPASEVMPGGTGAMQEAA